jgi:hypothetical protein
MVRCSRLVVALLMLLGQPAGVWADLIITERTVSKAGDRSVEGRRSTYIKGTRMRIELVQDGRSSATVYDLPDGAIIQLDAKKRQAHVSDVAARNSQLQKKYPRERALTNLTRTGATKTLAGLSCEDFTFTVIVPLTKEGKTTLTMNGAACLAADAAGVAAYQSFTQAAYDRQLVVGYTSDNLLLLALTRGQTELYRALVTTRGIPLHVDMTIGVDGTGMVAAMVRKALAGTRVSTVTAIEVLPLDDALFAIPADWKRDKK